jgi:hypothetical protein
MDAPRRDVFGHEGAAVVCDVGRGAGGAREAKVAELRGCWCDSKEGKRQTLRSQLAFRSRFEGLRSRWRTSALWSALRARRV